MRESGGVKERSGACDMRTFEECPFCGGDIAPKYIGIGDRLRTTEATFTVDECGECGAGVLNPAPTDASAFYPRNYLSAQARGADAGRVDLEKWYRYNQYRYDFKLLEAATGAPIDRVVSYLDLGCGSGERVAYARDHGCARPVGVDKFDFAKGSARRELTIVNADILDFVPREKFAVVSLFHVLEHLPEAGEVLRHVRDDILTADGHLIIQVPNYGAAERRWFKSQWFGLDVPRHLWHFNDAALRRLLAREGYKVDAVYQRNAPLHPVSIAPSINREVDVQRIWASAGRSDGYKRAMTLLWAGLTVLTMPAAVLASACGQGSMLTVVASRGEATAAADSRDDVTLSLAGRGSDAAEFGSGVASAQPPRD